MENALKQIIYETIFKGGWTQIWAAFCCFITAWIIFRALQKRGMKNVFFREHLIFSLWLFGSLWWFFNYLAIMTIHYLSFEVGKFFLATASIFIFLHLYCFLPVLLSYFTSNKRINFVLDILFGIGWFSFTFYYLITSDIIYRPAFKDYYAVASGLPTFGFLIGVLDFLFLTVAMGVMLFNFKREVFSLKDLSSFNIFFSIIIYAGASLLNVFLIYSGYLSYIAFALVPILTYFGYRKYLQ